MARPLKFKNNRELQGKIDEYFDYCLENNRPLTITGLAVALDTSRDILLDYEDRDEFSHTIKRAKLIIENYAEESLFTSKNVAGVIFNLKNNYKRWTDKVETDLSIANKDEETFNVNIKVID